LCLDVLGRETGCVLEKPLATMVDAAILEK
jgi:hypothetical protein